MNSSKLTAKSLHSVLRSLYAHEWDGQTVPTFLTTAEAGRFTAWRGTTNLLLPIASDLAFHMPWLWVMAIGGLKGEIPDAVLALALRIAAHGFLRDHVARPAACSKTAPALGVNAALAVLREVIEFKLAKIAPSPETLTLWMVPIRAGATTDLVCDSSFDNCHL